MGEQADVWLIVPVYNEAKVVADVVRRALAVFGNVVCVDDGSRDASPVEIARTSARLVRHPLNLGQGAALQTGLEYARAQPGAQYFVTFDSDGQHRVEDALAMVARLRAGEADVVLGTRFARAGDSGEVPLSKRVILRLAALVSPRSRRLGLTDSHNGLRAFNRTVATQLTLTSSGMAHAGEFIALVDRPDWRVVEQPVTIHYTAYSKAKGQSLLNGVNVVFDQAVRRR